MKTTSQLPGPGERNAAACAAIIFGVLFKIVNGVQAFVWLVQAARLF